LVKIVILINFKIEANFTGEGHTAAVTSIDHDNQDFIYTSGLDCKVIKWNIKTSSQESSFYAGPEKPTSVCLLENDRIAVAAKSIKIYGQDSKLSQLCIGHSSNILLMESFEYDDESYIISAAKNDRNLSLWKLNDDEQKLSAFANFALLNSSPSSLDYTIKEGILQITCVCRNDSLSYFSAKMDSLKSKKPVKSKFTLEIASDNDKVVSHIPVSAVTIASDDNLMIGYGDFLMKFELLSIEQEQKNVILVRRDPMKMQVAKKGLEGEDDISAIVTPIISKDVEVLNVISATKKPQKPVEIPLETRLDNLTVGEGRKPNAKKMTQQLIQGLHGKDANILRTVLRQHDEETVRLTVKYLPSQYVIALVNELSILMTKRTAGSEVALIWLRYLIQSHSSSLMAYGIVDLNATFGTTLGIIDHRAENFSKLQRLRGRLELLVRQIKRNDDVDDEMKMDNLLVYEDSGEFLKL
jgi:U3 small nucleolar RNA-associated protein 5